MYDSCMKPYVFTACLLYPMGVPMVRCSTFFEKEIPMKKFLFAASALLLLAACDAGPQKAAGCDDCEKMAMEANAKHEAMKAAKKDCGCCKGKDGAKHAH